MILVLPKSKLFDIMASLLDYRILFIATKVSV
jgi:hypothetical protein